MPKGQKLNDRQITFAEEYVKDRNATQAAVRAGYTWNYANQACKHLLGNIRINALIKAKRAEIEEKHEIDRDFIVQELLKVRARAIETDRLADANKALELLGKTLGIFREVHDINAYQGRRPADTQEAVERSRLRIEELKENAGLYIAHRSDPA